MGIFHDFCDKSPHLQLKLFTTAAGLPEQLRRRENPLLNNLETTFGQPGHSFETFRQCLDSFESIFDVSMLIQIVVFLLICFLV